MWIRYDTIREKLVIRQEMEHLRTALFSLLLAVSCGAGTLYLVSRHASLPAILSTGALFIFLIAFALSTASFLGVRAERPATPESIETLMRLVDRSPERELLKGEIRRLLDEQGELYQYQVHALILRARR